MEAGEPTIESHIVEIVSGLTGIFLTMFIAGYNKLMGRVKKNEEEIIKLKGDIKLNTELDKARAGNVS